jgi:hypothetical protein
MRQIQVAEKDTDNLIAVGKSSRITLMKPEKESGA